MKLLYCIQSARCALIVLTVASMLAASPGVSGMPLHEWGTGAVTATFDCGSNNPFLCLLLQSGQIDGPEDSGLMQDSASSSISNAAGSARASANLDSGLGLSTPSLAAEAIANTAVGGALASAFAIEVYTNTSGTDLDNIVLDLFLDDAVVIDSTPDDGGTFVQVQAFVVTVDSGFFNPSGPDDQLDEIIAAAVLNLDLLGEFEAEIYEAPTLRADPNGGGVQNISGSIPTFDLADGDSAFFLSYMTASALKDNSSADAFGTFTASFRGDAGNGLTSASNANAAVPEPGSAGLMAMGVAMMGLTFRRQYLRSRNHRNKTKAS